MKLIVVGLNHKTAPVEIRERFNFSRNRIKHILRILKDSDEFVESVLISTCNRTELYLVSLDGEDGVEELFRNIERYAGSGFSRDHFYTFRRSPAAWIP